MASAVAPPSLQRTNSNGNLNVYLLIKNKINDDLIIISQDNLPPTLRIGKLILNQKVTIRDEERRNIEGVIIYMHHDRESCVAMKNELFNKTKNGDKPLDISNASDSYTCASKIIVGNKNSNKMIKKSSQLKEKNKMIKYDKNSTLALSTSLSHNLYDEKDNDENDGDITCESKIIVGNKNANKMMKKSSQLKQKTKITEYERNSTLKSSPSSSNNLYIDEKDDEDDDDITCAPKIIVGNKNSNKMINKPLQLKEKTKIIEFDKDSTLKSSSTSSNNLYIDEKDDEDDDDITCASMEYSLLSMGKTNQNNETNTNLDDTVETSSIMEENDDNNVYLEQIKDLTFKVKQQAQMIKQQKAQIQRLILTTIEIPKDQDAQKYILCLGDKIRQQTTKYKYQGSLVNDAKKLGLNHYELNEILALKSGITRIARVLFQKIVSKEYLQVDCWNDLDPYVLVKEKILMKFLERYYGPLQMRPRVTFIHRQETVKRKNHAHWVANKCQISLKRMQKKVNVKRLQKRNFNHGELTDLKINDIFACLSSDEKTNNEAAEEFDNTTFDSDFENEYFGDIDEENVIHDSEDENGEDFEENEMIEEELCEKQIKFGNEFFNMESSTMSTRDYDEIVSNKIYEKTYLFLSLFTHSN
ncbi:unnamed protein product [Rotaria sp. Silwood2]|nr:unnamed protein product [Rotaria sp. Silwood2]CAF2700107.1 unnamed protein product [Rotaria sp. Silwood2]